MVLAGWGLALALWVGLGRGRETILVGGLTAATAVLLAYGTWLHLTRSADTADIPRLAARIEAHARGGEAGVLFETGWLEVDYYLGRPLREIASGRELEAYLARTGGPVLTNESTWNGIRGSLSPRVRVIERVTARGRTFVLLGWSRDASLGRGVIGLRPAGPEPGPTPPREHPTARRSGSAGGAASST
jgi:hypothetical protein